mmetsp:Transcript_81576/g.253320  ORF Transcript_81576/g.253320 Transcript_81576/m.253320 type:complete len:319 (-) Transcript_81576:51-1007(-)|eukprot:CAMPEP_0204606656 /NCGR_PEP_ID=MMETSP0661-20131031/59221_1 /ASSEMBLY_ACC=CAM_ASM_000606 /TAXON_ID=109239 /ORGANISM="Alexandrium margalefi, Strain AMGDE01CS-322" /LENGTH=318 /DNA_ID=CAMNT_0051617999 /DNA_START=57 /DNA_END=1013 /DNA_ORIENTATION=+
MRSRGGLLVAGSALCFGLGFGLDSSALVQSSVSVLGHFGHEDLARAADSGLGGSGDPSDDPDADEYLVDNSQLQHRGPGVLYRRSMNLTDNAGRDQYAAWGTIISGVASADGWVRVGRRFLPTEVKSSTVLVRQAPSKPKVRMQISYTPTKIRSTDGTWIPANITGPGSKPHTYNVIVISRMLDDYPVEDVPEADLQLVSTKREFVAVKPKPFRASAAAPRPGAPAAQEQEALEDEEQMSVKVEDFVGTPMEMKLLKSSPLSELMYKACDRASVARVTCLPGVQFIHRGKPLRAEDLYDAADLRGGDTIYMLRSKGQP